MTNQTLSLVPTLILQKVGNSLMDETPLIRFKKNIESSIIQCQHIPGTMSCRMNILKIWLSSDLSSRLTNNAFELKGIGINRCVHYFLILKKCVCPFVAVGIILFYIL